MKIKKSEIRIIGPSVNKGKKRMFFTYEIENFPELKKKINWASVH